MNKRQAKKDRFKRMFLVCYKWKANRKESKIIAFRMAIDTMRKYQQLKAEYENRLKADMVAMLTDIQLEIEEKASAEGDWIFAEGERVGSKLIQQKIDALKEVVEDGNN